jgi:hypothetical protein
MPDPPSGPLQISGGRPALMASGWRTVPPSARRAQTRVPACPAGIAAAGAFAYGGVVRGVPWWGVVSSAVAPVLLAGGWTVAAGLQPRSFNLCVPRIVSMALTSRVARPALCP